ncbi:MAG: NADP-dependent oxidoreductase [Azonexus sp.]|jgi:NADPH-dependent curcumin reductase CurA|nr:NADP-dependent oxidoreductase [Azonexus sp.]
MPGNKTLVLVSRPNGPLAPDHFAIVDKEIPALAEGQIKVRNFYASLDPGIRKTLGEDKSYWQPTPLGAALTANTVGRVLESRHAGFQPGDLVFGTGAMQEISVYTPGKMCWKLPPDSRLPLSAHVSILGGTGLTAYFGLLDVGKPQAGETVLVSGAAGAVGSIVGQIAKIKGCRVIGIAGGPEKTRRVVEKYGFDGVIDYRGKSREDLQAAIAELCPDGVDLYFDNIGGIQLDAALSQMKWRGRVAVCGLISEYERTEGSGQIMHNLFSIVAKTLRVEGFLSFVYHQQFREAQRELEQWILEGRLVYDDYIREGIESAPEAFMALFSGANNGKVMVRIAAPDDAI